MNNCFEFFLRLQIILEAILPHYLRHVREKTTDSADSPSAAKEEMTAIFNLSISMKALLASCEPMAK